MAFARQIGFVVPQSMVDREIVTNPSFLNVAGQYDDAAFRSFLAAENLSEQQIRSDIETAQLIRMITTPISTAARVPQAVAREYANLLLESRTGQLGAVPTAILARELQPSDQEIAAFYQQNQRSFSLPERRVLRFALIGREQLGDAVRASDQEVAAYYQQNQATYGPSETRSLRSSPRRTRPRRGGWPSACGAAPLRCGRAGGGLRGRGRDFPQFRREQAVQQTSEEVANAAFGAAQAA
jgi:peptidyl-prolyl cis-trans isomerase D